MSTKQKLIINQLLKKLNNNEITLYINGIILLLSHFGKGLSHIDIGNFNQETQNAVAIYKLLGSPNIYIIYKIQDYIKNKIHQDQTNIYASQNSTNIDGNIYITDIIGLQVQQGDKIYKRTLENDLQKLLK